MARVNVTVSLPEELLREARHLAVDKGLSLSGWLAQLVEDQTEGQKRYAEARDRLLQRLKQGYNFGTEGNITWTREELHER